MRRLVSPGANGRARRSGVLAKRSAAFLAVCLASARCGRVGYEPLPVERLPLVDGASGASGAGGVPSAPDSAAGGAAAGGSTGAGGRGPDAGAGGSVVVAEGGIRDARTDVSPPRCTIPEQPILDYCTTLPRLSTAATLDGLVDCGLALHLLAPVAWTADGSPDATAEYAVAWRPDGLYFFVRVQDASLLPASPADPIHFGDGVELFVDDDGKITAPPLYDVPGTRQFATAAPDGVSASVARGEMWAFPNIGYPVPWRSTTFRSFPIPGGYVLEAFVVGADLGLATWTLSAGGSVGVDLGIDVSYPGADAGGPFGHRRGQYFLSVRQKPDASLVDGGLPGFPFVDPLAFCTPTLVQ